MIEIPKVPADGYADPTKMEAVKRITRDLLRATRSVTKTEARFLVDTYYRMQKERIIFAAQLRAALSDKEPHDTLVHFMEQAELIEEEIKKALNQFAQAHEEGQWAMSITGVGPVIAAGLLAHVNLDMAQTAGDVWHYAGLDPSSKWVKGGKRPWNAAFKVLAYKLGESFVKNQNRGDGFYGRIFAKRKALEWERNVEGLFAEKARERAATVSKSLPSYKWYTGQVRVDWVKERLATGEPWLPNLPEEALLPEGETGTLMLPPAHIHARARRVAVKLFLSHYFEVAYFLRYGKLPPAPYAMVYAGHSTYIPPQNAHLIPGLAEAIVERYGPVIPIL